MLEAEVSWDDLDGDFAKLEQEVTEIVRGFTVETFLGILAKTPQYYGRLAASWNYSLNQPYYANRTAQVEAGRGKEQDRVEGPVNLRWRGHPLAVQIAIQACAGKDEAFRLGQTVWIANGADHGEGKYSQDIEEASPTALRAVNQPGRMVGRTLDRAAARYAEQIRPQRAAVLKTMTIRSANAAAAD